MNRTSISDLKLAAKDQLLGNYGIATGSFALLFVLIYLLMSVVMSAFMFTITQNGTASQAVMTLSQEIEANIVGMAVGAISVTFSVGYIYIMFKIARNEQASISDLFFVFRNHPDKVIIISLIMTVIQFVLLLPATIVKPRQFGMPGQDLDGKRLLVWVILYIAGFAVSFVVDLMLAMSFMIYLDDPLESVLSIVRTSIEMMRGNKFRYFYMTLSFIGYWFLAVLSLGIAFLWVVPYQTMTIVQFYSDLKEPSQITSPEKGTEGEWI